MPLCLEVTPEGYLAQSVDQTQCAEYALLSANEYQELASNTQLFVPDWESAEWVFMSILFFFALGVGSGAVFNMIRKARTS